MRWTPIALALIFVTALPGAEAASRTVNVLYVTSVPPTLPGPHGAFCVADAPAAFGSGCVALHPGDTQLTAWIQDDASYFVPAILVLYGPSTIQASTFCTAVSMKLPSPNPWTEARITFMSGDSKMCDGHATAGQIAFTVDGA